MLKMPDSTAFESLRNAAICLADNQREMYDEKWEVIRVADYHLTLQFVGRDLTNSEVALVTTCAFAFAEESGPMTVRLTGRLDIHATGKGRYLIAEVALQDSLRAARERMQQLLRSASIAPKDPFPFHPHVTIAEAPPTAQGKAPASRPSFEVESSQIEVKYGSHRMIVEL